MGVFWKVVEGFQNLRYDFRRVGGGVYRWFCRHVCRKISARVDGGTSGPSSVRRRGARTPIGASGNLTIYRHILYLLFFIRMSKIESTYTPSPILPYWENDFCYVGCNNYLQFTDSNDYILSFVSFELPKYKRWSPSYKVTIILFKYIYFFCMLFPSDNRWSSTFLPSSSWLA